MQSAVQKNLFKYLPKNLPKSEENLIKSMGFGEKNLPKNLFTQDPITAEIIELRSQLADVMDEIRDMSWGEGKL
jgi:hypothetical protein